MKDLILTIIVFGVVPLCLMKITFFILRNNQYALLVGAIYLITLSIIGHATYKGF